MNQLGLRSERNQMLKMLGWTLPPDDDGFWSSDETGPIHDDGIWPFAMARVGGWIIQRHDLQRAHEQLLTDYTLMRAVAQYAVDNKNDPAEVARYAQAMMDEVDKAKGDTQ